MAPPAPPVKDWLRLQPESLFQRGLPTAPPPFQNGRLFAEMGIPVATTAAAVSAGRRLSALPQVASHHAGPGYRSQTLPFEAFG
jgi:hypothetical protein